MKMNTQYIQQVLELFLGQCGYFYKATKANIKKSKDFFETFPFVFFNDHFQNELYQIIKTYPYQPYLNTNTDMKIYCYMIYEAFSKKHNLSYKSYETFYDDFEMRCFHETYVYKHYKKNTIHTLIVCVVLICCLLIYINIQEE